MSAESNVVTLTGARPTQLGEPNDVLIRLLEGLLESARVGELQSFIGTGFTASGDRLSSWADFHEDVFQMRGALAWLETEYVERHAE